MYIEFTWLDGIFLGQYLLMFMRLSYITIKGNLGKLLPQMTVLDKDELKVVMISANDIRVVIATK